MPDFVVATKTAAVVIGSSKGGVRLFDRRPHALQDPASLAASGALTEMMPPERAALATAMVKRLLALEERSPAQGEFNFMDVRRQWLDKEGRWSLRNYWMGNTADLPGALWLLYLQTGRRTEAIEALKISLWSAESAAAHAVLGQAYFAAGDLARARAELQKAQQRDPNDADARRLAASLAARQQ